MAMYLYPCSRAASAISSIVFRPSVSMVCMCTSPCRSSCTISFGSACFSAGFDLAAVLAHLRRDVVQLQRRINLFFRFAARPTCSLSSFARLYSFSV